MAAPTIQEIVNTTLRNRLPKMLRDLRMQRDMVRRLYGDNPVNVWLRHLRGNPFAVVDITGLAATEDKNLNARAVATLWLRIFDLKMKNLRVVSVRNIDRDVTTHRIVIDSRGWTG